MVLVKSKIVNLSLFNTKKISAKLVDLTKQVLAHFGLSFAYFSQKVCKNTYFGNKKAIEGSFDGFFYY
jgi:hypothetical protein